MTTKTFITFLVLAFPCARGYAQSEPPVDSLVSDFIKRGSIGNWLPSKLYEGCPNLQAWQRRGIDRLMQEDLTPARAGDLALVWMDALKTCRNSQLEDWYFRHTTAEIRRGGRGGRYQLEYWQAFQSSDSPRIRSFLKELMMDQSLPRPVREDGASILFQKFSPDEHRREYLSALESNSFPTAEFAWSRTTKELQRDGDGLLKEIAHRVRQKPALARTSAFRLIVESSDRYVSRSARGVLAEALLDSAKNGDLTANQRGQLNLDAQFLMREKK